MGWFNHQPDKLTHLPKKDQPKSTNTFHLKVLKGQVGRFFWQKLHPINEKTSTNSQERPTWQVI